MTNFEMTNFDTTSFDRTRTAAPVSGTAKRVTHRGLSGLSGLRALGVVALALAIAGCAPRPGADLPPYGDSVRHTKALQTYEPGDEVPPLHGDKAAEAMRTYRLSTAGGGQAPSSTQ